MFYVYTYSSTLFHPLMVHCPAHGRKTRSPGACGSCSNSCLCRIYICSRCMVPIPILLIYIKGIKGNLSSLADLQKRSNINLPKPTGFSLPRLLDPSFFSRHCLTDICWRQNYLRPLFTQVFGIGDMNGYDYGSKSLTWEIVPTARPHQGRACWL